MASYKIVFNTSADRELHAIDRQFIPGIIAAIEALADNPFPSGYRKLVGTRAHDLYRIKVRRYRVIYGIDLLN